MLQIAAVPAEAGIEVEAPVEEPVSGSSKPCAEGGDAKVVKAGNETSGNANGGRSGSERTTARKPRQERRKRGKETRSALYVKDQRYVASCSHCFPFTLADFSEHVLDISA